ncbi:7-cyano-7-deazaguanine synthase QueC [Roseiconus nitratireducens]|uniref:7-cyano-7-deazaguanine synthase QueC n=1 Tax=Roseiconus nitratireducens TaxID=2605748 RepID=UPI001F3D34CE|nr:7-cyano-7-deazaguanine synthase QueC [Roseiconus nitratireducens]
MTQESEQAAGAPAVVLLSGGLDSTTCLAIAREQGFTVHAISFRYGQRHEYELERATALAEQFQAASHRIVDINLSQFGGSALTDPALVVPKNESADRIGTDIPITYVPARNTVFLSLALALAETLDCTDLFIGVNALDYSGYPDCRPEYIAAFEKMANLATRNGVAGRSLTIHAPLIDLTKAQIIAKGIALGVDYSKTLSCYDPLPGGRPCGQCDACLLRQKGFDENHLTDPAIGPAPDA